MAASRVVRVNCNNCSSERIAGKPELNVKQYRQVLKSQGWTIQRASRNEDYCPSCTWGLFGRNPGPRGAEAMRLPK